MRKVGTVLALLFVLMAAQGMGATNAAGTGADGTPRSWDVSADGTDLDPFSPVPLFDPEEDDEDDDEREDEDDENERRGNGKQHGPDRGGDRGNGEKRGHEKHRQEGDDRDDDDDDGEEDEGDDDEEDDDERNGLEDDDDDDEEEEDDGENDERDDNDDDDEREDEEGEDDEDDRAGDDDERDDDEEGGNEGRGKEGGEGEDEDAGRDGGNSERRGEGHDGGGDGNDGENSDDDRDGEDGEQGSDDEQDGGDESGESGGERGSETRGTGGADGRQDESDGQDDSERNRGDDAADDGLDGDDGRDGADSRGVGADVNRSEDDRDDIDAPPQTVNRTASVQTSPPRQAQFEISLTRLDRTSLVAGERVRITVGVENTGEREGTFEATLRVDGERVASESVTVAGGTSGTVVFEYRFDDPGVYELAVGETAVGTVTVAAPDTATGTRLLNGTGVAAPPDAVEVTAAATLVDWVRDGHDAAVRATVVNTANRTATRALTVTVDGRPVANESVTLGPNERVAVTLEFEAVEGSVAVEGVAAGSVEVGRHFETTEPAVETGEAGGDGPGLDFTLAALVVAAGVLAGTVALWREWSSRR